MRRNAFKDILSMDMPMSWTSLLTLFEQEGNVHTGASEYKCTISLPPRDNATTTVQSIRALTEIPFTLVDDQCVFTGTNAVDFLGKLYENVPSEMRDASVHYADFRRMLGVVAKCQVVRTHPDAILPTKSRASDVGYDLTIIKHVKKLNSVVSLYDTGIKVSVSDGIYTEVVPRSSLSKSGYMLANSIGIIDASYTGNILVALAKIDPDAADIVFPFRCCQLIFRKQLYVDISEVATIDSTSRGDGGFGSTG